MSSTPWKQARVMLKLDLLDITLVYAVLYPWVKPIKPHFISASQELMVNQDRYGLFRPTADGDGKIIHAEWATDTNVHLDVSDILVYNCLQRYICF